MLSFVLPRLLLLALVFSVTGCSGGDQPSKAPSTQAAPEFATIEGRLLAVGGPLPGDPRPMKHGTITLTGQDGSRIQGQIDATGHYAIGVSPGRYRILARSKDYLAGREDCLPAKRLVVLEKGATATVDLFCSLR